MRAGELLTSFARAAYVRADDFTGWPVKSWKGRNVQAELKRGVEGGLSRDLRASGPRGGGL